MEPLNLPESWQTKPEENIHTMENFKEIHRANDAVKRLFPNDWNSKMIPFKKAIAQAMEEIPTHSPMVAAIHLVHATEKEGMVDGITKLWLYACVYEDLTY